jgi:hypothetical protein
MNSELIDYLSALGAPEALQSRVAELVASYEAVLDDDIGAWFVSEYVDEPDQRTFESLWLFTATFAMEAQLLGVDEDHFDFVPFKTGIKQVIVEKRSFDMAQPTSASRMTVETWFEDRRYGVMRATGDNCGALLEILKTVLLPNAG